MKKILFAIFTLALLAGANSYATDTTDVSWQRSLVVGLTTTQTGYSDSWVGGEAGSFNWVLNMNSSAEKQLTEKFDFKSTLKVSFGQTKTQDAETKEWSPAVKSTDLIDFENVGKFTLGGYVDPYIALRLETQFYDGTIDSLKQYFSPLKFTESVGVLRVFYKKEKETLTSRLGLGLRQIEKTTVREYQTHPYSDPHLYAIEKIDTTLTDGGMESVTDAVFKLSERMVYTGKLTLYKAFFFSGSDATIGLESEDYWKAVDVNWENIISAQVSKIITVNLYTQLLYDKEISKKGRFKETIAIGFIFKMI